MSKIQINDLSHDEQIETRELEHVRGGIIAVLIGLQAKQGDGSVMPTDQFSLNFTRFMPTDQKTLKI